jgi:Zinc finger, C3HC4 type (RING finger)
MKQGCSYHKFLKLIYFLLSIKNNSQAFFILKKMPRAPRRRIIPDSEKNRVSFAWAKYFSLLRENNRNARDVTRGIPRTETGRLAAEDGGDLPKHVTDKLLQLATILNDAYTCPVCLEIAEDTAFSFTKCGHALCIPCHTALVNREKEEAKCPTCRKKLPPLKEYKRTSEQ